MFGIFVRISRGYITQKYILIGRWFQTVFWYWYPSYSQPTKVFFNLPPLTNLLKFDGNGRRFSFWNGSFPGNMLIFIGDIWESACPINPNNTTTVPRNKNSPFCKIFFWRLSYVCSFWNCLFQGTCWFSWGVCIYIYIGKWWPDIICWWYKYI